MKTLSVFLLLGMILFLIQPNAVACSLNPTANIVTDPEGIVFYHNEAVGFEGTTSTANCGSINQYRWRIDDVTVSWNAVYSHTFSLAAGESERVFKVQLRVRNSAGNYGFKTMNVTVTRNNKSLYYLTDHLGSVRVTVNEQGDPVGWDDYYPFGLQMPGRTQNTANSNDDIKFTGYELEQECETDATGNCINDVYLGLYHAEARMYDPVIGRFNSVDPLASVFPGWTPYTYALNNPLIYIDPDGRLSTHVDSTGNVIAVYDDGDRGVYQHSDLGSGDGSSVADRRTNTSTTHGGGTQVGHTLHEESFSVGNRIDLSGVDTGGQLIDYFYGQARQMSLLGYARSAIDGGRMDPKRLTSIGGFIEGGSGLIVSSRDVGNIVAGMVARDNDLISGAIFAAYGEFNAPRVYSPGRRTDAAISIALGLGTLAILQPQQTLIQTHMFLKEDPVTITAIIYGYTRR